MKKLEIIANIPDCPGYFISNKGRVYCNLGKGARTNTQRKELYEIKPRLTKNGYARVYLRNRSGKRKDYYIHRLVAMAYLDDVNHKNCIRDDNDESNLEWATAKENTDHTISTNHIKRDSNGRYVSNFKYSI